MLISAVEETRMASQSTKKRPVLASQAVVCANNPIASAVGLSMLASGGTVADAAVAAMFTLSVVEPMMIGPLGAGYIMARDSSGDLLVVDNYAEAPGRATPDMYQPDDAAGPMATVGLKNRIGHLAVGTPGALRGWFYLHSMRGRLPIEQVMAPAIAYAEHGFPVSGYTVRSIASAAEHLAKYPHSANQWLPGGKPPSAGQTIANKELAKTLRTFAAEGPDSLYDGPIGDALVEDMQAHAGLVTKEDLRSYEVLTPESIHGSYRDYEVIGSPLTSGGGILNQLGLNIFEQFDMTGMRFGTARYYHLIIETMKIMFADRAKYLGDPQFVDVPQTALLAKAYAKSRASDIRMDRAQDFAAGQPVGTSSTGHTTHLTVMAADGSVITMTQTINEIFGAKAIVPGTGLMLNNTMALFDPHPGRPNSIASRKRMLTATAATIVMKNGAPAFALGTPGGTRIFGAVLQGILNVIDHGMDLQEAVEAPRVWSDGRTTEVETGVPEEVRRELEAKGHKLTVVRAVAGGMNGVQVDPISGLLLGAACWRADGSPAGLSGGEADLVTYT
jgi:gamma-glutamyltranspeptidase/glutathione hydrolase